MKKLLVIMFIFVAVGVFAIKGYYLYNVFWIKLLKMIKNVHSDDTIIANSFFDPYDMREY